MTYKLTIRTAPGALIAAEYECPIHGRFALDVPREENGDPPAEVACPADLAPGPGASIDYASAIAVPEAPCEPEACGLPSLHVISAPGIARVRKVEAHRGGYQRPELPTWTDTTNLGEGQDLDDWKDDRAKVWQREREREAMEMARDL